MGRNFALCHWGRVNLMKVLIVIARLRALGRKDYCTKNVDQGSWVGPHANRVTLWSIIEPHSIEEILIRRIPFIQERKDLWEAHVAELITIFPDDGGSSQISSFVNGPCLGDWDCFALW